MDTLLISMAVDHMDMDLFLEGMDTPLICMLGMYTTGIQVTMYLWQQRYLHVSCLTVCNIAS